ncbi:MAG: sulfur carrier protein ThiS [Clostridiales bacterium]|nr:sulfur carrier protein ThiS [Clostridiales bacterium]
MTITVSGNKKEVKDELTVAELIVLENVEMPEYTTVSVNEEFIQRGDHETHKLKEGDVVEFLYFMGGGRS